VSTGAALASISEHSISEWGAGILKAKGTASRRLGRPEKREREETKGSTIKGGVGKKPFAKAVGGDFSDGGSKRNGKEKAPSLGPGWALGQKMGTSPATPSKKEPEAGRVHRKGRDGKGGEGKRKASSKVLRERGKPKKGAEFAVPLT